MNLDLQTIDALLAKLDAMVAPAKQSEAGGIMYCAWFLYKARLEALDQLGRVGDEMEASCHPH